MLWLGLGLGDLDVGAALDDLDQDVSAILGAWDLDGSAGGNGSLGGDDGREDFLAVDAGGTSTRP